MLDWKWAPASLSTRHYYMESSRCQHVCACSLGLAEHSVNEFCLFSPSSAVEAWFVVGLGCHLLLTGFASVWNTSRHAWVHHTQWKAPCLPFKAKHHLHGGETLAAKFTGAWKRCALNTSWQHSKLRFGVVHTDRRLSSIATETQHLTNPTSSKYSSLQLKNSILW